MVKSKVAEAAVLIQDAEAKEGQLFLDAFANKHTKELTGVHAKLELHIKEYTDRFAGFGRGSSDKLPDFAGRGC